MTTEPNELAAERHERMPVIRHGWDVRRWLDPMVNRPEAVKDLLGPYPVHEIEARPVSKRVNRPNNEGPELIHVADDSVKVLWK